MIGEAIENAAIEAGKKFAAQEPNGADLQSFAALQYLWEKDDALQVKVIHQDEQQFDYNVTRCRYAEMYHQMGLGEIGHLLSCARDSQFIVGYAPDVELQRTQTIMSGAPCRDFRYAVKPSGEKKSRTGEWRTPVAKPARYGAVRRHPERRRHPAGAERRRPSGARPIA